MIMIMMAARLKRGRQMTAPVVGKKDREGGEDGVNKGDTYHDLSSLPIYIQSISVQNALL